MSVYWLIERGSPAEWWAGSDHGWTRDTSKVHPLLRFEAMEQAQGEADRIKNFPLVIGAELRVTEHIDCAGPAPSEKNSEAPTPRTDAEVFVHEGPYGHAVAVVAASLARQLERELAEATGKWTDERDRCPQCGSGIAFARSATTASEDAACKVAASLLRNEIVRLEYPKGMFPQEAEKIGRRQTSFQEAVRFLDPDAPLDGPASGKGQG